ncbi:MAG: 1,4-alpha-glucan branching protein GlgB [Clostridiales bacterium]|nr:1,4-alpha-glucan branching protein GlgB [Clostridiales bacterium]
MKKDLDFPVYLFHQGTAARAYELLGAHPAEEDGKKGYVFRVWAPNARQVFLTGDFNSWSRDSLPMKRLNSQGVWTLFAEGVSRGERYKYRIQTHSGQVLEKADPYGFHMETRPGTASVTWSLDQYSWKDSLWMAERERVSPYSQPMNIYEVHLGSWRRYADGNFFDYGKLAEELPSYVKDMGYTHMELMPAMEYPFDGSWGYQVTGYYAASSRYGSPEGLMALVDACHQQGLGVILDWVPGHFPRDAHGLSFFDGTPCYEYGDPFKQSHEEWGTLLFDWGRNEVRSFLISNALFWLEKYHFDGLRVDAVASMLYLDYGRRAGSWRLNVRGGKENLEAVSFLQALNQAVFAAFPNALMIAEESTAWPLVTKPPYAGGLGFNFKWNMGWMNDTLDYMKTDPLFRKGKHHQMTFSSTYAFSENFILPLSHDEVVHRKASLLNKMPGRYEEKFAAYRTYLAYMMAHPGKKLTFMGAEFGQFSEWNYEKELDWNLLGFESHEKLHRYVKALNHFYLENPPLWERDCIPEGFQWLDANDSSRNIYSFRRMDSSGGELLCIFNFAPVAWEQVWMGVPESGWYHVVFHSDAAAFGGSSTGVLPVLARALPAQGMGYSVTLDLPPLSAIFLQRQGV